MVMRLNKILLAGVLLVLPLLCRAQKNIFNTYNDMKGVSSVYISKAMMEMNPSLFTKDVYIGKVSGRLECVQIISTMDNDIKKNLRKDLRSLVQSSKYELLMKQKGNGSSSEFYINKKGDKVRELIMIIDGAANLKFVYLEGEMTLKDIQSIMMYQNTSMRTGNWGAHASSIMDILAMSGMENMSGLDALNNLGNWADLRNNESLKKLMDANSWKRFEEGMKMLEKRLVEALE